MTEDPLAAYRPASDGPTALFLDTSGLFAYFHPDATEHAAAQSFLRAVGRGDVPYRPLYTSTYVVDELVTLLQSRGRHEWATDAFEMVTDSENVVLLEEETDAFERAGEQFRDYDDHAISFTDHLAAVQMRIENVDHVFAYGGDYRTLGLDVVPRTGD